MNKHEIIGSQFAAQLVLDREQAMTDLFACYHPLVYTTIYRMVRNRETARDLTQELFLQIAEGRRKLETTGPLGSYLRRMAINFSIDHLRKQRPDVFTDVELLQHGSGIATDAPLEAKELQEALHEALQQLPDKCATIFMLSRFEQLSYREIAGQLNISKNTVENQMVKALKMLRVLLNEYFPVLAVISLSV